MKFLMGSMCVVLCVTLTGSAYGFGQTGHRAVGRVAENHLTPAAQRMVKEIIGPETLPYVSTWPDEIRSDADWSHADPWHYVTIEDGETYASSSKNPRGDIVTKIQGFVAVLSDDDAATQEKTIALKWLVHLVGDIHQPLHVGRGADRGGNDIDIEWFGKRSNQHSLWDSGMIESTQLSFSELAEYIDTATPDDISTWQEGGVLQWAAESKAIRDQAYESPEPNRRGCYRYLHQKSELLYSTLLKAGIRLAGLLNRIADD